MDLRNIIQEISPIQLRLHHIRHDLLHEWNIPLNEPLFLDKRYKDNSCIICRGEPPESTESKYKPLRELVSHGDVLPSLDAFHAIATKDFRTTRTRKRENIFAVIYLCRFKKYPTNWDRIYGLLESYIEGRNPPHIDESYLPEYTSAELHNIREGLASELRTGYQIDIPVSPLVEMVQKSPFHLSTSEVTYEETPLTDRSANWDVFHSAQSDFTKRRASIDYTWDQERFAQHEPKTAVEQAALAQQIINAVQSRSKTPPLQKSRIYTPMSTAPIVRRTDNQENAYFFPLQRTDTTTPLESSHPKSNEKEAEKALDETNTGLTEIENYVQYEMTRFEQNLPSTYSVPYDYEYLPCTITLSNVENVAPTQTDEQAAEQEKEDKNVNETEGYIGTLFENDSDSDENERTGNEEHEQSTMESSLRSSDTDVLAARHRTIVLQAKSINTSAPPPLSTQKSTGENQDPANTRATTQPETITLPIQTPIPSPQLPPTKDLVMNKADVQQLIQGFANTLQGLHIQTAAPVVNFESQVMPYDDLQFIVGRTHPRKFMEEVEKRFEANKVEDLKRRLQILCSIVNGPVKRWIEGWCDKVQHNNPQWSTKNNPNASFTHSFVKEYTTPTLRKKLSDEYYKLKLEKHQSVADYATKLEEYWFDLSIKLDDTGKVDKFIQGLPSSMKIAIYQQGEPANFNEARKRACNVELARMYETDEDKKDANKNMLLIVERLDALSEAVKKTPDPTPVYAAYRAPLDNQGPPPRNYNKNYNNSNNSYGNRNKQQKRGNKKDLKDVQCYRCKNYGHLQRNCRTPICNKCGTAGHYANKCSTQPAPKNC